MLEPRKAKSKTEINQLNTRFHRKSPSYVPTSEKRQFPRPKMTAGVSKQPSNDYVSTAHWGSEQCQVTDKIDGETAVRSQTAFAPRTVQCSARTRVAKRQG
ncbi:hypothetical protein ACFX12_045412 [Malus domestica]